MRRWAYKSVVRLFAVLAVAPFALFLEFVFQGSFTPWHVPPMSYN